MPALVVSEHQTPAEIARNMPLARANDGPSSGNQGQSAPVQSSNTPASWSSHGERGSSDAFIELDGQDQVGSQRGFVSGGGRLHSPAYQIQVLNNQLRVENRIKEGAENLLQMPLTVSFSLRDRCVL